MEHHDNVPLLHGSLQDNEIRYDPDIRWQFGGGRSVAATVSDEMGGKRQVLRKESCLFGSVIDVEAVAVVDDSGRG